MYAPQNMVSKWKSKYWQAKSTGKSKPHTNPKSYYQQTKKVNKELEHLANTINKPDLIKIYTISYPIKYTHRTFTKTDDILETNFKGLKSYRIYSSNIL